LSAGADAIAEPPAAERYDFAVKSGQGYTFGPYRLDPSEGHLTNNGEPVRVAPNALALLTVLVTRAGYLVSNAELSADAWPNADADEGKLAMAVATLRTALGDERGDQYIETVPRIGYRFIAPVEQSRLDTVWLDQSADGAAGSGGRWSLPWAAAGVLLLGTALVALFMSGRGGGAAPASSAVSSLVVIPFQTAGPGGEQVYLGLGMADALAMRLGGIEQLRVPPTAAVQRGEDAFDAGRRLGVDAVITGSIQRDGGRVRVTAQLSRVGDRAFRAEPRFKTLYNRMFGPDGRGVPRDTN
jgi:DNA-binding winged helix-turn-helix (wHTH) protein/TolB-like protein